MVADAAYYQRVLEGLYTHFEGLDTTGYEGSPSDAWTQGRYLDGDGVPVHLACWFTIRGTEEIARHGIAYNAILTFLHRYNPSDDSLSQARVHATARHAIHALLGWRGHGCRALPTEMDIEEMSAEWVAVHIAFRLSLPLELPEA